MIVFFQQRGDSILLFLGIECLRRHVIHDDWIAVERPQQRPDVPFVIEPRSQPRIITAWHELAGHLAVRGRQRLEAMKDAGVANRPGREDEYKSKRENRAGGK